MKMMINRRQAQLLLGLAILLVIGQHMKFAKADEKNNDSFNQLAQSDESIKEKLKSGYKPYSIAGESDQRSAKLDVAPTLKSGTTTKSPDNNEADEDKTGEAEQEGATSDSNWDDETMSLSVADLIAHWEKGAVKSSSEEPQSSSNEPKLEPVASDEGHHLKGHERLAFGGSDLSNGLRNKVTLNRMLFGLNYEQMYGKINNYLVDHEPSNEFDANLKKANELLDQRIEAGVRMPWNRATVEALEQLVALDTLGQRCDRLGYIVNWRNNRATRGEALRTPSKFTKTPRRITALVHTAFLRHAIKCLPVYMETFKYLYNSLDLELRSRVESAMVPVAANLPKAREGLEFMLSRQPGAPFDPVAAIYKIKSLRDVSAPAQIFYAAVNQAATNDPEHRYLSYVLDEKNGYFVLDTDRIRALVKRHLVEPCNHFISTLGPDVFIPAKFDSRVIEEADRFSWYSDARDLFVRSWVNYRLCELLVYKDHRFVADKVIAYARTHKRPAEA